MPTEVSLRKLLIDELRDAYHAEKQLVKARHQRGRPGRRIFWGSAMLLVAMLGCSNPQRNEPASRTETEPKPAPNSYDANNTGRNAADRDGSQATPGDQGNNSVDLDVTQKIRQAILDESSLSVSAKNVKVVTTGGKVTLRGPVQDATERSRIEAIAERIAGTGNVTSQLELETPKS